MFEQVLHAVMDLDIATARGRHAAWMSACRPTWVNRSSTASGCMTLHAARHPLLLQRVLPPLPRIPGLGDAEAESMGITMSPQTLYGHSVTTLSKSVPVPQPAESQQQSWKLQPLDLLVPPGARVAVVTGPNTGYHHGRAAQLCCDVLHCMF